MFKCHCLTVSNHSLKLHPSPTLERPPPPLSVSLSLPLANILLLVIGIVFDCLSPALECQLHEGMGFGRLSLLLSPQSLEQHPADGRHNEYLLNERM